MPKCLSGNCEEEAVVGFCSSCAAWIGLMIAPGKGKEEKKISAWKVIFAVVGICSLAGIFFIYVIPRILKKPEPLKVSAHRKASWTAKRPPLPPIQNPSPDEVGPDYGELGKP